MKRRHIGIATGLLGNFMFGWGLYHLLGIGSCGGEYPPCPSSAWPYFVTVPVGMIVSILSIFAGGGFLFLTTFGSVGVASILRGINGGVGPEHDTTFAYVFGGFFLLPLLLPFLFVPWARRRARQAERLVAEGRKGIATVTAVRDTGLTVNNDPRVELTLSIEPEDGGAAFEASRKMIVSRLEIPRVGDRYDVSYDPEDRTRFELRPAAEPAPAAQPAAQEWVTELGMLNDLRLSGALSDEEFSRAKDRLLAGSPPAPVSG